MPESSVARQCASLRLSSVPYSVQFKIVSTCVKYSPLFCFPRALGSVKWLAEQSSYQQKALVGAKQFVAASTCLNKVNREPHRGLDTAQVLAYTGVGMRQLLSFALLVLVTLGLSITPKVNIVKLTSTLQVVAPKSINGGLQNESSEVRIARMRRFWASPENGILYPVGRLLSLSPDGKVTLAEVIARTTGDNEVEMSSITVDGKTLPLADGFKLSLANMIHSWACPACRSAHGSGVAPSRKVDVKGLMANKFYYRPSDRALFTISETCWSEYVKKLDAATATRFVSPAVSKASKQVPVPVKA